MGYGILPSGMQITVKVVIDPPHIEGVKRLWCGVLRNAIYSCCFRHRRHKPTDQANLDRERGVSQSFVFGDSHFGHLCDNLNQDPDLIRQAIRERPEEVRRNIYNYRKMYRSEV